MNKDFILLGLKIGQITAKEVSLSSTRQAYILTSHWEDQRGSGHMIKFFCLSNEGPFEIQISTERPVLFVERNAELKNIRNGMERKTVGLKTFRGLDVDALYFKSQRDLYEVKDELAALGLRTYESDIRTPERFLMERFIKGSIEVYGDFTQSKNGLPVVLNPKVRAGYWRPSPSTCSVDIETSMGSELFSIGLHYKSDEKEVYKVFMVGEDQGSMPDGKGELLYFPNEKTCYQAFEQEFHLLDPDILIGWHVVGFDLVFLEKKCVRWGIDFSLGRRKSKTRISEKRSGQQFASMQGRVVIDGPPSLRAAFYSFENFKLDTVAHELLGTKKDINSTGIEKVKEIERRFKEDKTSLAKYNLQDCILVTDIYKKTGLIDLIITRTLISGLLMDRIGVSTAAFDFFMLPQIHRKGYVAPNIVDIVRDTHAAGGYVLDPVAGLHDYVAVFDFRSLYPSIMRTFNIDPYSRIKADISPVKTPAGIKFSRTEHILSTFIAELLDKRSLAKKQGDMHLSQAIKILMNSFYGVMGSAGSRFYHADLPTAITESGQWVLREAVEFFENEGYQVVYGDTDSIFVKLKEIERSRTFERVEALALKANEHITKVLAQHFDVESKLELEFERLFKKIFLPKMRSGEGGAKKRYAGLLTNVEREEELYFSGMEFVRSDWTKLAKSFQWDLYEKFFNGEEIENFIRETVESLKNGERDHELTYQKRLVKKLEEYTKSVPPHVKAARLLVENGKEIGRSVYYVITRRGAIPVELEHSDLDYQHYIDKQIRPIAEAILHSLDKSFDSIVTGDQLSLF